MPLSSMCGNPYLLAVLAAVAIGVAVYEIVTNRHEKAYRQSNNRPRPPGSGGSRPPPGSGGSGPPPGSGPSDQPASRKPKDPPPTFRKTSPQNPLTSSKSTEDSSSQTRKYPNSQSETSDSESSFVKSRVRKRNVGKPDMSKKGKKGLNETLPKNHKEFFDADSSPLSGSESEKISPNTYHKNVDEKNYEKTVYGNILNDTKEINTVTKSAQNNVNSNTNICDEDSDSENNISDKPDNVKLCNIDVSDQPVCSSGSNNLSQSSAEEEIYKKSVLDALKNENIKCQEQKATKEGNNVCQAKKDENLDEEGMTDKNVKENQETSGILNRTQGICSGCEEASINAVAYPCGHCYLCLECATIIFRIHKICSVCLTEITKFESRSM